MGYRATVTRTVEGHRLVNRDHVVKLADGKFVIVGTGEEVEEKDVILHVTLKLGDTVLAEEWNMSRGLSFAEAEEIEDLFGKPIEAFEAVVDSSARARKILIHTLLKRTNPDAKLEDLDNVSRGDWDVDVRVEEIPEEEPAGPTQTAVEPTMSDVAASSSPEPEPPAEVSLESADSFATGA